MSKQIRQALKELRFTGGRFEQNKGWLDIDVLPELEIYKRLLIEMAKEEWRLSNPGRERLPKGFEEKIHLGFREVREGSCAVPLERIVEVEDDCIGVYVPDEVDEAVKIIDATLIAVRNDAPFPDRLSARIIPMFEEWGKTLTSDEGIVLDGQDSNCPRFDATIRSRILNTKRERYEDIVDLVGEIRAAELRSREGGSFSILLDNGDLVSGNFTDEQEKSITEALHEHRQVRLRIVGRGEFEVSGQLRRILRVDHLEERATGETPFDPKSIPIWDVIKAIGNSIPEEEWNEVPTDFASNLDHYLYGDPKEDE
jgi:hypothetical protein